MFTGIVEEKGKVISFKKENQAYRLVVECSNVLAGIEIGDSIAVNGCCLTAVEFTENSVSFDLLEESVRLTSIQSLEKNSPVNLETSLKFNGKVGGHFVTGHVDGLGTVKSAEYSGSDLCLTISPPEDFGKYLVYKGSIAVDGVSLTVANVRDESFDIWLIPHTLEVTNLSDKKAGSLVNLEFDILAKYTEKLLPKS